jgi:hypothetical protein
MLFRFVLHTIFFCLFSSLAVAQTLKPAFFSQIVSCDGGPKLYGSSSFCVSGDYAYVANTNPKVVEVLDVSNPKAPVLKYSLRPGVDDVQLNGALFVSVVGKYLFVVCYGSLEIFDISNPIHPFPESRITHMQEAAHIDSPGSFFVLGDYAYVTNKSTNSLEIIDITNRLVPTFKGRISNGDGGAVLTSAGSIFVQGDYAYVGAASALEIVDVSNPAAPKHKGKIDHGTDGASIASPSVYVAGNYAYIASTNDDALEIVDVTNPSSPTHKGIIRENHRGTSVALYAPTSVYVSGDYAYVSSSTALEIVDISNPVAPVHKGSIYDKDGGADLSYARRVSVANGLAYVLTQESVEIINVNQQSSPFHLGKISHCDGGALLYGANKVCVLGNYAYVTYPSGLEVIDISDPLNPIHRAYVGDGAGGALLTDVVQLVASGNFLYLLGSGNALEIMDVSNPALPVHKGNIRDGEGGALLRSPGSFVVSGNHAYVASSGSNAIEIIDISNASLPSHKGSIIDGQGGALLYEPKSIFISGNLAYVVGNSNALEIVDITNPAAPVHKGSIKDGDGGAYLAYPFGIDVENNYAYIVAGRQLEIVDVTNPSAPIHKGKYYGDYYSPGSIHVFGKKALDLDGENSIGIFDVTDPSNPVPQFIPLEQLRYSTSIFYSGIYAFVISSYYQALVIVSLFPPSAPVATPANFFTHDGFTANWTPVVGAQGYEIEFSIDDFKSIFRSYTLSKGVYRKAIDYLFPGIYKYRVRALNGSGASANSNVIVCNTKPVVITGNMPSEYPISVYPNPVTNRVIVEGISDKTINISLVDVTGQSINVHFSKQEDTYVGDLGSLKPGVYILSVDAEDLRNQRIRLFKD